MDAEKYSYSRYSLKFQEPETETSYQEYMLARTLLYCRIAWGMVILFGGSFALMDRMMFGQDAGTVLLARGILLAMAALCLAWSFNTRFRRYMDWNSAAFILSVGLFCVLLVALDDRSAFSPYFVGLFYAFTGIFCTAGLGFRYSFIALLAVLVGFDITIILLAPVSTIQLILYNFFLPSMVMIFAYISYLVERISRENYIVSSELSDSLDQVSKQREQVLLILDSMESGVLLIETESRTIIEINQEAAWVIGGKREDIVGKPCWAFIKSGGETTCPILDLGRKVDRHEDTLIKASGEELSVLKRAKQIELDGRNVILESFVDISELKRAEEAVRSSEAKFRSLFESSRDAIMLLDQEGFIDCNHATLEMFGCNNAEEFLGRHPIDFSPPFQPSGVDSRTESNRHLEAAFERGSRFFEWVHRRMNGEEFPAEVMLSAVDTGERKLLQALVRDITTRKRMEEELKRLASTDPLTGADNRRSFIEKGDYELLRCRRYGHPFSFLMMDIDHFKAVNDTYGHQVGDQVLKSLVSRSNEVLRETDLFGRVGGEEFAVILPETDAETALLVGERLRSELAKIQIDSVNGSIQFTVSLGLAVFENGEETLDKIMSRADSALYQAKETGRNRLVQS